MNALKIHLGYVEPPKQQNNTHLLAFDFDLTKFPSLFINLGKGRVFCGKKGDTPIIHDIIEQVIQLEKTTKNVKTLIIDRGRMIHCSALYYDTYCVRPQTALKGMYSLVNKIYNQYLKYSDFVPRTKYVIIVNDAWGLEQYLADIMEKLGSIGVYLVFSGGDEMLSYPVNLQKYLFGQIVCIHDDGVYKNVYMDLTGFKSNYGMALERFRPEHKLSGAIYTDYFYKECYARQDPIDIFF